MHNLTSRVDIFHNWASARTVAIRTASLLSYLLTLCQHLTQIVPSTCYSRPLFFLLISTDVLYSFRVYVCVRERGVVLHSTIKTDIYNRGKAQDYIAMVYRYNRIGIYFTQHTRSHCAI